MKIYLAAKYNRRFELRPLVDQLETSGHESTAQWINNAEESKGRAAAAQMDVDDVLRADVLIFFAEPKGSANSGGGRYFELGLAHASGLKIIVILVDDHETVFTALPNMIVVSNFDQALNQI